jgi:GT2 family glycosyltransferase
MKTSFLTTKSMKERVTLVVVPREQFSLTEKSLESIYQNTNFPFKLVYIDCNSPSRTKRYLEIQAKEKEFHLIRCNDYLTPNQARNIALAHVKTEYVVFIDNDILVKPGWLDALVQCADETGAWIVGPLCLEGDDFQKVHMAGGSLVLKQRETKQWVSMKRPYFRTPLTKIRAEFKRQQCDLFEFHCCLTRMDIFEKLGPLDERIMNLGVEEDLCLTVLKAGKPIFFEPASVMTYVPPERISLSDIPFFFVHWSEAWGDASLKRLQEKWNINEHSPMIKGFKVFLKGQKYTVCKKPQKTVDKLTYSVKKAGLKVAEKFFNRTASLLIPKATEKVKVS